MPYGESFIGSPGLWIYLRKDSGVEHFLTWCVLRLRKNQPSHSIPQRTLTVGGRITVLLVPCLTRIGCDKTRIYVVIVCIEKTKMKKKRTDLAHLKTFLVESKPVKQETSYTVYFPLQWVFSGLMFEFSWSLFHFWESSRTNQKAERCLTHICVQLTAYAVMVK